MSADLKQRIKQNANEVTIKMAELLRSTPLSEVENATIDLKKKEYEDRKAFQAKREADEKKRVLKKLEQCSEKANSLIDIIRGEKDVEEMTDQEIREAISVRSKEWKIDLGRLRKLKEEFDLDVSAIDLDEDETDRVTRMDDEFKKAEEDVTETIKALLDKDKELGLFTLAPLKNKEHISYPKVFSGKIGENVHKFISEFKLALDADHVRTKDRIKVLLKYLDSDARTAVGEHTQNLETAFDILKSTYGDPSLIWNSIKENSTKSLSKLNVWGKVESVERRNSITKLIDFINEAKVLATEHDELKPEIHSLATVKHIWNLAPKNIRDDFAKRVLCSQSVDDKFKNIETVLKEHRETTITRIAFETKSEESKTPFKKPSVNASVNSDVKHNCKRSSQCEEEWDILGCI